MTSPITTSTTDSQMHNIMVVGSRDRPPMLAPGRYAQWQSSFMRYVDTRPNNEALKKRFVQGPYKLSHIIIPGQPATAESSEVPKQTAVETFLNISPENKAHYDAEKEVIHLLLTGIRDEIYSTVDACKIAHDMWIAIERLQHGESLNKQDVKTNLFWELGRFTLRDRESVELYYSRFDKKINEMTEQFGNQKTVTVVGARETVGSQVVQQTGIQCFNCKEFGHFSKECKKPKREKDYTYRKRKMLLCKQVEKELGYDAEPLENVQYDAEYNVFANERQYSEQPESINNTYVVENDDSNVIPDSSNICDNENQAD
nr:hypothetical protein [Tanacetum cinerariifolium]